jgi:hypothetical protein
LQPTISFRKEASDATAVAAVVAPVKATAGEVTKKRQTRAPNARSLNVVPKKSSFLQNVYRKERETEADILIQCMMHIVAHAEKKK